MTAPSPSLAELLVEYDRALAYTAELWSDLAPEEVAWRPNVESSAIGWHLGHQPAVAHFMVRNLTAAEPSIDAELDALMDSATAETDRGQLPDVTRLGDYRDAVAERVRFRIGAIDRGEVGAPAQLRLIAHNLLVAVINHEYQHDKWVGEVRVEAHGRELPPPPTSPFLATVDGYLVVG
ncbi:MAG: DinB family protein [Actinomycetota bacterium]